MSNVHVREKRHSSFSNARSDVQTRNVAASARISLTDSSRVRQPRAGQAVPPLAAHHRRQRLVLTDREDIRLVPLDPDAPTRAAGTAGWRTGGQTRTGKDARSGMPAPTAFRSHAFLRQGTLPWYVLNSEGCRGSYQYQIQALTSPLTCAYERSGARVTSEARIMLWAIRCLCQLPLPERRGPMS